jgi:hypothetical protein
MGDRIHLERNSTLVYSLLLVSGASSKQPQRQEVAAKPSGQAPRESHRIIAKSNEELIQASPQRSPTSSHRQMLESIESHPTLNHEVTKIIIAATDIEGLEVHVAVRVLAVPHTRNQTPLFVCLWKQ